MSDLCVYQDIEQRCISNDFNLKITCDFVLDVLPDILKLRELSTNICWACTKETCARVQRAKAV